MMAVAGTTYLDESQLQERFVRSPGPGGQNVNKLSTAVQLRLPLHAIQGLPADAKQRLILMAGRRLTKDEVLVVEAHRFRTQERNRQDALERLLALIRQALQRPVPRRPTTPTAGSQRRRLEGKRHTALIKRGRARVRGSDD